MTVTKMRGTSTRNDHASLSPEMRRQLCPDVRAEQQLRWLLARLTPTERQAFWLAALIIDHAGHAPSCRRLVARPTPRTRDRPPPLYSASPTTTPTGPGNADAPAANRSTNHHEADRGKHAAQPPAKPPSTDT